MSGLMLFVGIKLQYTYRLLCYWYCCIFCHLWYSVQEDCPGLAIDRWHHQSQCCSL